MARGQSQFLRIFDEAATVQRWQNYYGNTNVPLDGEVWAFIAFDADGFTVGQTGDEGGITVTLPGTALVMDLVADSMLAGRLAELTMYEFDTLLGDDEPQAGQVMVANYVGEIVSAGGPLHEVRLQLGSSLSPIGAQIPPRKFTSRLVGVPCRL